MEYVSVTEEIATNVRIKICVSADYFRLESFVPVLREVDMSRS